MFAVKIEQELETGTDAAQVIGMNQIDNIIFTKSFSDYTFILWYSFFTSLLIISSCRGDFLIFCYFLSQF